MDTGGGREVSRTGTAWHELPSCVRIRCIAASASPAPAAGPRPGTRPARAQSAHRSHVRTAPARRQPRRRPSRPEHTHVGGAVATAPGPSPAATSRARAATHPVREKREKYINTGADVSCRTSGGGAQCTPELAPGQALSHTSHRPVARSRPSQCCLDSPCRAPQLQRPWSSPRAQRAALESASCSVCCWL